MEQCSRCWTPSGDESVPDHCCTPAQNRWSSLGLGGGVCRAFRAFNSRCNIALNSKCPMRHIEALKVISHCKIWHRLIQLTIRLMLCEWRTCSTTSRQLCRRVASLMSITIWLLLLPTSCRLQFYVEILHNRTHTGTCYCSGQQVISLPQFRSQKGKLVVRSVPCLWTLETVNVYSEVDCSCCSADPCSVRFVGAWCNCLNLPC